MRISTIIPAYNRATLIGATLDAVLAQTRAPAEVIVVDDGSSDGTADAVAAYGKSVTLIRQANAGPGAARNAGFAASSGELVQFMDSDDIPSPVSYAAFAAALEAGADVAYGPWLKTRFDGARLDPEAMVMQQAPVPGPRSPDVHLMLVDWFMVLQACLFRRDAVERAGPYRTDLMPTEDIDLFYRVLRQSRPPVHVPDALLLYRVHPENQISEKDLSRRLIDRARLWTALQAYADARDDLDPATCARFRRKKHDIAVDVRPFEPAMADALDADVTVLDRRARRPRRLADRLAARARVATTGNPYPATFAAAPLRADQRETIAAMGFALPG